MRLDRVQIKNFRSIEDIEIEFDPSCRTLVGINESGKSNILKALSMISESVTPVKEDIREPLPKEKPKKESCVEFVFKLDHEETELIYDTIEVDILTKNIKKLLIQNKKKEKLSLKNFCDLRNEGLFTVDVKTQKKATQYWELDDKYTLIGNWKKPSSRCPPEFTIDIDGKQVKISEFSIINADEYEIDKNYLEDIEVDHINELIGEQITELVSNNLPEVILWEYKEENLLQPSTDMNAFVSNPESNIPLKNMFALAGIEAANIQGEIEEAKAKSSNSLRNLLRRVADHTTKHFRGIWKEYKDIKFTLEPNADNIDAGVAEKNVWSVNQRSDGFKRFVTFLLLISAQERIKSLKDTLLLIDEPDISLHPSGARYLRDELIEISKSNYVVYSTHSIFMIDRTKLERHIKVKKTKEKTTVETANESNIFDEEVLFNAVGASVFDVLKEKNFIFEGWRDKKLFDVSISKPPRSHKELKLSFKNYGRCHAQGVKDVSRITPMLELANRECIIISDADKIAREKQKNYKDNKGYGRWLRYDEISPGVNIFTGEDFIKESKFDPIIKKIKSELNTKRDPDIAVERGRIYGIRKWLSEMKIVNERQESIIKRIKEEVFEDLKVNHIEEKYFDFLQSFSNYLEKK